MRLRRSRSQARLPPRGRGSHGVAGSGRRASAFRTLSVRVSDATVEPGLAVRFQRTGAPRLERAEPEGTDGRSPWAASVATRVVGSVDPAGVATDLAPGDAGCRIEREEARAAIGRAVEELAGRAPAQSAHRHGPLAHGGRAGRRARKHLFLPCRGAPVGWARTADCCCPLDRPGMVGPERECLPIGRGSEVLAQTGVVIGMR